MIKQDPNVGYDFVPRKKNRYPRRNDEFQNLSTAIVDFILDDNTKFKFDKDTKFFLQGSCFVENLFNELRERRFPCFYNAMVEALNSPHANSYYLKELSQHPDHEIFREIKNSNVYILTIGVAPCWFLKSTGEFVLKPDLRNIHSYVQRTTSVGDAISALHDVFDSIYKINEKIEIVLTLSPVPLGSTYEFSSAIVADCISKSVLRAAIHEAILGYSGKRPAYFPSFEIVRWVGGHVGDAFGDDGLPRHVSQKYVKQIIASFLSDN